LSAEKGKLNEVMLAVAVAVADPLLPLHREHL
jgi:hypothetical protein